METAVVLPVFMMVLTGIYTFGIAYNNKIMLTNATTVAAQRLQQLRTSTSDPCLDTYNALLAAAPTLDSSKVTMSFTLAGTTFGSYTGSAITCTSGANYLTVGSTFTVSAYYPCTISAYAFSTSSCQLSATVSEYEY